MPETWLWAGAVASIAMGRRDSGLVKGWGRPFTKPRPGFFGEAENAFASPLVLSFLKNQFVPACDSELVKLPVVADENGFFPAKQLG